MLLRMKLRWRLEDAAFASAKTTLPDIPAQPGSRGPKKGRRMSAAELVALLLLLALRRIRAAAMPTSAPASGT